MLSPIHFKVTTRLRTTTLHMRGSEGDFLEVVSTKFELF
jgi:hypothetical protein